MSHPDWTAASASMHEDGIYGGLAGLGHSTCLFVSTWDEAELTKQLQSSECVLDDAEPDPALPDRYNIQV